MASISSVFLHFHRGAKSVITQHPLQLQTSLFMVFFLELVFVNVCLKVTPLFSWKWGFRRRRANYVFLNYYLLPAILSSKTNFKEVTIFKKYIS